MQFRHSIKRGLQKTPCCKHRIKTARQRDDDVIDKTHHQMYASTASITGNNGIQLTLEQALAPGGSSSTTSGGSTSSTGTASSGDGQPLANSKVGTPNHPPSAANAGGQLNNAFYLNNLRNPLPPPYVNNQLTSSSTNQVAGGRYASANGVALNHQHHQSPPVPASLPASVRATPTADFELYPRHLRTHSYTQATQPHHGHHNQIHNQIQNNNSTQHRDSRVPLSTPSYRRNPPVVQQYQLRQLNTPNILSDPGLYDKIHGRQSSSSAGS